MLKTIFKLILLALVAVVVIQVIWYQIDGIPSAEADAYLEGDSYAVRSETDGSYWFEPDKPNGAGIVIMHGALILPKSYAKSAAFFARNGYTVHLPHGPLRMSILATGDVAEALQKSPIETWFFVGHSMGGMASLETISSRAIDARGVALWATSMPADYTEVSSPILFIWGDNDGLLPAERFAQARKNLPSETRYVTLEGANHKNFAQYSHQFFDNEAQIDWDKQIGFANQTTLEFFNSLL
jgi:pimeloyl-ACP methyl ester carboxylesterase